MYDILELNKKLLGELRDIAKELKIKRVESFRKQDLIYKILDIQAIVVSENKTGKKESSRKENPKKGISRKEKEADKSEASPPEAKKRPGRPKKDKKREPDVKATAAEEHAETKEVTNPEVEKESRERRKSVV